MGDFGQGEETGPLERMKALLRRSGLPMSDTELESFSLQDLSLGNLEAEGFGFVDVLRTDRLRVTVLVLLPGQTLPEHLHPSYDDVEGKEETVRVLYGETRIYVPGDQNNSDMIVPEGKEPYYSALHEIRLLEGEQYTVTSPTPHWFQGGPEGSVNITFQDRVDETQNIFTDPGSSGCPIPGPSE